MSDQVPSPDTDSITARNSPLTFEQLADALPQLVWTTTPDGKPDYFNKNWLSYTGQTPEDKAAWWSGGVHPQDLAETTARWRKSVQTGAPFEMEYRLKGANGEYRWFLARGLPLRNEQGKIIKWFGTCTLIDEQKRTEQTQRFLAELSAAIRPLSDPAEVLWAVVNALGTYLHVTHCTYAEVNVEKNQFTGYRDFHWQGKSSAGVYPLDYFGTELISSLKSGHTFVVHDTQTDTRVSAQYEAAYAPSDIRAFIIVPLLKNGQWIAALSVTMHGQPRAWRPEESGLVESVVELTWLAVDNLRLYQAERERSEQLTLAISEVHHRVKNSLQNVAALLEFQIPRDAETISVEAVRDGLSQIKTIALVHDLLARDKPIGSVDAARVLENLGRLLSSGMSGGSQHVEIRVEVEPVEMTTRTATSLALAVNELLTNAIKHAGRARAEGGPVPDRTMICITMARTETDIRVVVQDNGPGFPDGFDGVLQANIGLQLVQTLVEYDLQGTVDFGNAAHPSAPTRPHGASVEILYPQSICTVG